MELVVISTLNDYCRYAHKVVTKKSKILSTVTSMFLIIVSLFSSNIMYSSPVAYGQSTDPVLAPTSVTASGNDGNVPSNAFDNNLGTRWSNLGKGSFITANLGSAKTVSSVDIAWYNGASRTNNFVISTSTDGTTFTPRFSGTSALSSSLQNYDLADVNAQYVRVTVNGNSQNNWASISEIRIHGVSGPDTTAPTVVSTSPASGATGVGASANVVATFSEAMNPSSVTSSFVLQTSGGTPVQATVSMGSGNTVATLNPTGDLTPGATYTAIISTAAEDVAGNNLAAPRTWSFTVSGATPTDPVLAPTSVTASGNDGNVPSNAFDNNLGTRWSNFGVGSFITANLGSVKTVSSVDIAWYNGVTRTNNFVISTSTDGATFTPRFSGTSALSSGFQNYDIADVNAQYVRVTVNGNSQNNWASISEIRIHGVSGSDTTAPTVVSTSPASGATGVGASANVVA